jgi:hypothetical protein
MVRKRYVPRVPLIMAVLGLAHKTQAVRVRDAIRRGIR